MADRASARSGTQTEGDVQRIDQTAIGLVLVVFLTEAAIGVVVLALAPQYPISGLGFGDKQGALIAGFALSVYGAAKMPGQPISGWLADRFDPRMVLISGLFLTLPVLLLMARVPSAGVFVGACAGIGFTLAVVWPAMYAAIGGRFASTVQGRIFALVSAGQIAGTLSGVGAGAVLIDRVSYGSAFAAAIFFCLIAALLTVALVQRRRRLEDSSKIAADGVAPRGALRALADPSVALLITLIMIVSVGVAMLQPDLKPYSQDVLHLTYSQFVLLLVPPAAIAAALLVPAGYLADRVGRAIPMVGGLAIFAAGLLLIPLTRTPVVACAITSIAIAGYVLSLPALSASLVEVSDQGNRGLLTGLSTSIQAIGIVIGPLIGGWAVHSFGALAPFRFAALVIGLGAILAVVYSRRMRTSNQALAAPRPSAQSV